MCSPVKNEKFSFKVLFGLFSGVFLSMLASVVFVDCVNLICRFGNGRGVFLFVVMGCVVWFGGLFLCDCGCV